MLQGSTVEENFKAGGHLLDSLSEGRRIYDLGAICLLPEEGGNGGIQYILLTLNK